MPNVSFQAPTDYSAEQADIERRRKYADLLRQQSLQPLETQSVGGWAIPNSPTQGLAKMLQAFVGARSEKKASDDTKALASKYQTDLVRVLNEGAQASAGSPARVQPPTTPNDDEGNPNPQINMPASPGDPMKAASLYMQHPATQALGMQEMQRQRMMDAFGLSQGAQGASPEAGATNPGASTGASQASGMLVPRNIALQLMLADPTGKLLAEANAKAQAKSAEPINVRPGGAVWQQGQGVLFNQPQVGPGVQLQYGPNGPTAAPIPGAAQAMGAQAGAIAGGTEAGKAPYQLETLNTEGAPTLMTRQQAIQAATGQPMPQPGAAPAIRPPQPMQADPLAGRPPEEQAAIRQVMQASAEGKPLGVNVPRPAPIPTSAVIPGLRLQDQGESAQQKSYGTERGQILANRPQATVAARTALTNMERLNSVAQELENHPGLSGITGKVNQYSIGDLLPETRAARALQETMVKQSAVQTLQAMRDASKTGGAVGAVTEKEWPILEQQLAALNGAQGSKDYKVALKNLQNQMAGAMRRVRDAYKETYGEPLQFESTPYQTQGRSVRDEADAIIGGGNNGKR